MFIDEVYSLAPRQNDRDSFSKEALDILTAFLSENKQNFCCIAAGYEDEVKNCFFKMNKGLKRRFPWIHKIEEYTSEELSQIFLKMVRENNWKISIKIEIITEIITKNIKLFKYGGGDVETFLDKCKIMHATRVFSLDDHYKFILSKHDLEKGIELMIENNNSDDTDENKTDQPFGLYI